MYSCQVSRKSLKRKWPNGCVVFITKTLVFSPLSGASGAISLKVSRDHSFSVPHPYAKFCPNPSSLRGDMSENCLSDSSQYRREANNQRLLNFVICLSIFALTSVVPVASSSWIPVANWTGKLIDYIPILLTPSLWTSLLTVVFFAQFSSANRCRFVLCFVVLRLHEWSHSDSSNHENNNEYG